MNSRILTSLSLIAVIALALPTTSHAIYLAAPPAVNIAATGTVTVSQVLAGSTAAINDQNGTSQIDIGPTGPGSWLTVTWPNNPQKIDRVLFEQLSGYSMTGYQMQVAQTGVANPSGANNAQWQTVSGGSFVGQPNTASFSAFSPGATSTGIRVLSTDLTNIPDNRVRVRELWAFSNYKNLAQTATINAPGWTGGGPTSLLVDEQTVPAQVYTSNLSANPNVTFSWSQPQLIGGVLIHGGAGAPNEHLIDYKLQQHLGGGVWADILTVIGNTQKTRYHDLAGAIDLGGGLLYEGNPINTDGLRIVVLSADNSVVDDFARIAEVEIFGVTQVFVPEPSTLALFSLGAFGLAFRTRRRRTVA